ncbi:MAG: hypothetical protein EA403_13780 [Spirochaetaceae bacterium]|nr:MAG: hypothetical protein EA403_13780 [Spirochaetaceae bacterium]
MKTRNAASGRGSCSFWDLSCSRLQRSGFSRTLSFVRLKPLTSPLSGHSFRCWLFGRHGVAGGGHERFAEPFVSRSDILFMTRYSKMAKVLTVILVCAVLLPGCAYASQDPPTGGARISSYPQSERLEPIRRVIEPGSSLAELNPTRLGPGAAYYLARLHQRDGNHDDAEALLLASWQSDPEPWRRAAVIRLLDHLLDTDRAEDALSLAMAAEKTYSNDTEIVWYRLEALYRTQQYRQLFAQIAQIDRAGDPATRQPAIREPVGRWIPDADLALWRAVAAYELQAPDWREHFARAFTDFPASPHHSRLYLFARARGDILPRFSRSQGLLAEARYHLADGRNAQSARLFRALIEYRSAGTMDMKELVAAHNLSDIGRAFISGGDWRLSLFSVDTLIPVAAEAGDTAALARLYEYQGRLLRSAGNRQAALPAFAQAISMEGPGPDRDRVVWYAVQTSIDTSLGLAIRVLEEHGPALAAPARVASLVDGLASRLVQERDWTGLHRLYSALDGFASEGMIAQVAVINGVALRAGLSRTAEDASRSAVEQADLLLRRAAGQWENPYYALVASVLLGDTDLVELSSYPAEFVRGDSDTETYAYAMGLFRFGLLDEGYRFARSASPVLSSHSLGRFAATLAADRSYIDSMRLMDVVARRESRPPTAEQAALMYPRAFAAEMATVMQAEALEPEIFYALVREESYFSPGIGSHVGAIGLSQLMPATAAEVARAMRLPNPDLTDPLTNLSIGGRYLRSLINRFGSLHYALLGYNAGPTRVRRWSAQRGSLPPVLFQESIPFAETRHYIRKIFVSAVQYGRLYGDVGPQQIFETLFALP